MAKFSRRQAVAWSGGELGLALQAAVPSSAAFYAAGPLLVAFQATTVADPPPAGPTERSEGVFSCPTVGFP
jgi:hypothetical protein